VRLAELEAQRHSAQEALNAAKTARTRDARYQQTQCSFAELLEELPDLWTQTSIQLQQELARAFDAVLAESAQFGGLFADPLRRGKLTFPRVAKELKADDFRTIATRRALVNVGQRARAVQPTLGTAVQTGVGVEPGRARRWRQKLAR